MQVLHYKIIRHLLSQTLPHLTINYLPVRDVHQPNQMTGPENTELGQPRYPLYQTNTSSSTISSH